MNLETSFEGLFPTSFKSIISKIYNTELGIYNFIYLTVIFYTKTDSLGFVNNLSLEHNQVYVTQRKTSIPFIHKNTAS